MSARFLFIFVAIFTLIDSMIGSLIFQITGSIALANIILFSKYVIFGIGFCLFIVHIAAGQGFLRHELYGLLYLLIMSVMIILISIAYPEHAVANRFYSYIFPVIIYFFGSWISQVSTLNWKSCFNIYASLHIALTLFFGIPVYLFGAEFFWKDILQYGRYVQEIKGFDDVLGGLPGNFFYDPYFTRILRFVGSLGDPLAVAYSSMILAIAAWYSYTRWNYVIIPILLLFIVLAITRAALIGFIIGVFSFWIFRKWSFSIILLTCTITVFSVFQFGEAVATFLGDSSTEGHVESIGQISRFVTLETLIGGTLLSGESTVFEPGLMNILFSFGFIPLVLLIMFMYGIFRQHVFDERSTQFVSVLILAGLVTLLVFSPSFFAITSSWFAWFIAGVTSRSSFKSLTYIERRPPVNQSSAINGYPGFAR